MVKRRGVMIGPIVAVLVALFVVWQGREATAPSQDAVRNAPRAEAPATPRIEAPARVEAPPVAPPEPTTNDRLAAAVGDDAEAQKVAEVIALIEAGGPFPYRKDGSIFSNREKTLPIKPRGYYREYTVPTPGEDDRGARRIVRGQDGETYYTRDHYRTFIRLD